MGLLGRDPPQANPGQRHKFVPNRSGLACGAMRVPPSAQAGQGTGPGTGPGTSAEGGRVPPRDTTPSPAERPFRALHVLCPGYHSTRPARPRRVWHLPEPYDGRRTGAGTDVEIRCPASLGQVRRTDQHVRVVCNQASSSAVERADHAAPAMYFPNGLVRSRGRLCGTAQTSLASPREASSRQRLY